MDVRGSLTDSELAYIAQIKNIECFKFTRKRRNSPQFAKKVSLELSTHNQDFIGSGLVDSQVAKLKKNFRRPRSHKSKYLEDEDLNELKGHTLKVVLAL